MNGFKNVAKIGILSYFSVSGFLVTFQLAACCSNLFICVTHPALGWFGFYILFGQ